MKKVYQVAYRFSINGEPTCWIFSGSIYLYKTAAEQYVIELDKRHEGIIEEIEIVERVLIE